MSTTPRSTTTVVQRHHPSPRSGWAPDLLYDSSPDKEAEAAKLAVPLPPLPPRRSPAASPASRPADAWARSSWLACLPLRAPVRRAGALVGVLLVLLATWAVLEAQGPEMTLASGVVGGTYCSVGCRLGRRHLPPYLNDPHGHPLHTPPRYAPEALLRKLLRLPGRPAVLMLHYYSWYVSKGDSRGAGLFSSPSTEGEFTTLAAYYDVPSLSLRAAVHPLLRANASGFRVDRLVKFDPFCGIQGAEEGRKEDYFYGDCVHPSDRGHQAVADLLIGAVQQSAAALLTAPHAARQERGGGGARDALLLPPQDVPPPLQSGVMDAPTSLCLMQEDFKGAVVRRRGFQFQPERPNATSFVGQARGGAGKWGWASSTPGSWAELEIDTRESSAVNISAVPPPNATVYLGIVRSYHHMGRASVECRAGCTCAESVFDGSWPRNATLQSQHALPASQHPACRIRVTVSSFEFMNNALEFEEFQGGLLSG
eukprot:scaffold16.g47.t1